MKDQLKKIIKSNRLLFGLAKLILSYKSRKVTEGRTKLNILRTFPMFEAHGWGLYPIRAKLTIQSVNQVVPALASFASKSEENKNFENFLLTAIASKDTASEAKLSELFRSYGSDKSTTHNYHKIYHYLLKELGEPKKILEIGLGTNNVDVVSTMGKAGKPGASLRAFRDFTSHAKVFGADLDRRILFTEERIETYFVDQTDPDSFMQLSLDVGGSFDLMIDDGLHSPNANLHSLHYFLENIKVGGFAVVEDINMLTKPLWNVVEHLIQPSFVSAFIETKSACMFIVQRKE
jgi:hypothetical protein